MSIVIVDFSGVFRRHWSIVVSKEGEDIGTAARNTVRDITALAAEHEHVAICIDMPPYERTETYPEYKGTREKQPASCYELADRALDELREAGFPVYGQQGQEADDIIASIVKGLPDGHDNVVIYSSDKDLHQLLRAGVSQWSPALGDSITVESFHERYGINPDDMTTYLALIGDSSDNIPGVEGVGPKTAVKLITAYDDIPGILEACAMGKLSPSGTEKMDAADLERDHKLVTLRDDLPIDLKPLFALRERKEPEMEAEPTEPTESAPEVITIDVKTIDPDGREEMAKVISSEQRALVIRDRDTLSPYSIEPVDKAEAWKLAQMAYQSRAIGLPNPESALLVIMAGRIRGIDAFTSLQSFHVIKGKVTPSAQMLQALCMRSPECEYFQMVSSDDSAAAYETKRKGAPKPTTLTYTMDQAKAAGLTGKDNWKGHPDDMLRARCVSKLARIVYPDVTLGLYAIEEF